MCDGLRPRVRATALLYCACQFFEGFALIYPAYLVLFRQQGLSVASISVLLACATLPVLVLEVPSGVLADRFGRRPLVVGGLLLKALGMALWGLGHWDAYIAGFLCWGAQEALCSGAQEALLYDALKEYGAEKDYARFAGYARASSFVATALAMALGGFVAARSATVALGATVSSTLVAAGLARLLPEAKRLRHDGHDGVRRILSDAQSAFATHLGLCRLIVFGSLLGAAYGLVDEYDQLFVESLGFSLPTIGLLGCGRFLVEAAGGGLASHIGARLRLSNERRLGTYLSVAGGALVAAALAPPAAALGCYAVAYVVFSSGSVLFEQRIQDSIESPVRATMMSAASLLTNGNALLLALGLGAVSQWGGIRACIGGIALVSLVVSALYAKRVMRNPATGPLGAASPKR